MVVIDPEVLLRCACGHLHPPESLALIAGSLVCRDTDCYQSVVQLHTEGTPLPVFRRPIDPGQIGREAALKAVPEGDSHGPAPVVLSVT